MRENYRELLKKKKCLIGVWGTGYIGFSTMAFFAAQGVRSLGCDVDPEKIAKIRRGEYVLDDLKAWLNLPLGPLSAAGLLEATTDPDDLARKDLVVHFVAIPTEKDGKPYFAILENVIGSIGRLVGKRRGGIKPLVIIESTLCPRTSDRIVIPLFRKHGIVIGRDILYGVAPRRDWFVEGSKNLTDLDRVFGGYDEASSRAIGDVLGIVCRKLHRASNCYVSEMVKSFENAYRHAEITLANQISLAYPSQNIREALELAGTKWNIGKFRPGFGTGGYCIPVASKYVLDGAERPAELGMLKETVRTDEKINRLIARSLIKRGLKRIGVLGLSYKGNLKVSVLSPTIPFIRTLVRGGADAKIFDPYFTAGEITDICGVGTFDFPRGLQEFDAVVLVVDHREYAIPKARLLSSLGRCRFILDNAGLWARYRNDFRRRGIEYHLAGDAHWL